MRMSATTLPLNKENVLLCKNMQSAAYKRRTAIASEAMGMWSIRGRSGRGTAETFGSDEMNMMVMAAKSTI